MQTLKSPSVYAVNVKKSDRLHHPDHGRDFTLTLPGHLKESLFW